MCCAGVGLDWSAKPRCVDCSAVYYIILRTNTVSPVCYIDIPSGQAVLTDLLEQSRELERYIRGGNLPAKPRHHKRRGSVARRARNWFQALKGKIMSWTYTSTTVHHGQQ